jgi:hypothetical protein
MSATKVSFHRVYQPVVWGDDLPPTLRHRLELAARRQVGTYTVVLNVFPKVEIESFFEIPNTCVSAVVDDFGSLVRVRVQ